MKISRSLLTFAFVKESLDSTGDFVQGLMPLFIPIVRERAGKDFSPNEFAAALNERYGLQVRPEVIEDWAKRLADKGLLHAVEENGEIVRYINIAPSGTEADLDYSEIDQLLDDFIEYISQALGEQNINLGRNEIEEAIFKRLRTMEFHNLLHKQQPSHLRDNTLRLPNRAGEPENTGHEPPSQEAHLDYLCASYALSLRDSAPEKFDVLFQIAGGALVSEVVLDLRIPPKTGQDASGLTIFIDPPLVIDALNIAGEEEFEFASSLFAELRELKASLRIFNSGADEIRRIFHSILEAIRDHKPVGGSIGARLRTDQFVRTRVVDISKHLEDRLADLDIEILNFDEAHSDLYKHFSADRETDLVARIRPMREIVARETDARAAANVFRLVAASPRRANVFSTTAVFLSKNSGLIRQTEEFFKREQLISDDQAPPFLTDKYMAGLLWVLKGGRGDDITRRKLVANCASAISPRRDVITQMYQILSELDDQEAKEFEVLMTEKRPAFYLMEHSLGDATLITKDNAHKILEQVRLATAEKVIEQKDREKEKALEEQAALHRLEMAQAQEVNDELRRLEKELKDSRRREAAHEEKLLAPCVKAGTIGGLAAAAKIYIPTALLLIIVGWVVPLVSNILVFSGLAALWLVAGFFQFWFLPSLLFGKTLRRAQEHAFQNAVRQRDLGEIAEKFVVDWDERKLIRKNETTNDLD